MIENMTVSHKQSVQANGFSLVEMMVVVSLAAMILISALGVYQRLRSDAAVIMNKLDETRMANEVLQRIAEDIDRIAAPGFDAAVQVRNKIDNGFASAQLTLESKYFGGQAQNPQPRIYERVIWQTAYDMDEGGLILYRMHGGLNVEDKVLEENKSVEERALFIPTAAGLTFFKVEACNNQKFLSSWTQTELPKGLRIGVSFAPMVEDLDGRWAVPEEKIIWRTVAIDRVRTIAYRFQPKVMDVNDFMPIESPVEEPNQTNLKEREG
ncbi:MAG TPA: prepilin-type N-terminal cleavage/methylation domain-containing protein [Anaerohalosphaeraceae bacterium]|nr:prepilin-type N-terminal cleavage/methylation domain-containing protein [Anaerohalosphaeraceae bacterium]